MSAPYRAHDGSFENNEPAIESAITPLPEPQPTLEADGGISRIPRSSSAGRYRSLYERTAACTRDNLATAANPKRRSIPANLVARHLSSGHAGACLRTMLPRTFLVVVAERDHVLFRYTPKLNGSVPLDLLGGFSGDVIADASSVYHEL